MLVEPKLTMCGSYVNFILAKVESSVAVYFTQAESNSNQDRPKSKSAQLIHTPSSFQPNFYRQNCAFNQVNGETRMAPQPTKYAPKISLLAKCELGGKPRLGRLSVSRSGLIQTPHFTWTYFIRFLLLICSKRSELGFLLVVCPEPYYSSIISWNFLLSYPFLYQTKYQS